jgi:hypothetical protein
MSDSMPLIYIELDFKNNVALRPPKGFEKNWVMFEQSLWRPGTCGKYYTFDWAYDPHDPTTVHVIIGRWLL